MQQTKRTPDEGTALLTVHATESWGVCFFCASTIIGGSKPTLGYGDAEQSQSRIEGVRFGRFIQK